MNNANNSSTCNSNYYNHHHYHRHDCSCKMRMIHRYNKSGSNDRDNDVNICGHYFIILTIIDQQQQQKSSITCVGIGTKQKRYSPKFVHNAGKTRIKIIFINRLWKDRVLTIVSILLLFTCIPSLRTNRDCLNVSCNGASLYLRILSPDVILCG